MRVSKTSARRRALTGLVAVGVAVVLAACSSDPPQALTTTFRTTGTSVSPSPVMTSASSSGVLTTPGVTSSGGSPTAGVSSTSPPATSSTPATSAPLTSTTPTKTGTSKTATSSTKTATKSNSGSSSTQTGPTVGQTITAGANEAADRAAIEKQWVAFWDLYVEILAVHAGASRGGARQRSPGPCLTETLVAKRKAVRSRRDSASRALLATTCTGQLPVADESTAVIGDCMDQGGFGSYDTQDWKENDGRTNQSRLSRAIVDEGSDGTWRVQVSDCGKMKGAVRERSPFGRHFIVTTAG